MLNAWPAEGGSGVGSDDPGTGLGWLDIARIWRRASWWILALAVLGGAAAYAVSLTIVPTYEADATLLLDTPDTGRLGNAADTLPGDAQQRAAIVKSQTEIIRGESVVSSVIAKLHLADRPMFQPKAGLPARLGNLAASLFGGRQAVPHPPAPLGTSALDRAYLDHLTVEQDPETYILHIGFRSSDPTLAAEIVNAHVASYLAWLKAQRTAGFDRVRRWLETSVEAARGRVATAEAAVQRLNATGVVTNVDGRSASDEGLSQLTTDLAEAQATLVKAEARAGEIEQMQRSGQSASIAAMSGSTVLEALQAAYSQSQTELASLQTSYGPAYPGLSEARARAAQAGAAVRREIANLVAGEKSQAAIARASVANLTAALGRAKTQVVSGEGDRATLKQLESRADAERTIYLGLLGKLRSYDELDVLAKADVTELSSALVPAAALSPRRGLFATFGFLFAGCLAAAASVWRVNRRDVVRRSSDVWSSAGIRCLGVMPFLGQRDRDGSFDQHQLSYTFFREEMRSLCALLARERTGTGRNGISLLVTSSLPGEGKSSLCRELAGFAARSGVRTLLVHGDRTARGSSATPNGAVPYPLDEDKLLYGVEWSGPPTTLGAQGIERSVERWCSEFGLVVFDTPPITAMAEALILAPFVDATLLVARVDHTPRPLMTSVIDQLIRSGGRLAGFFLTFVHLDRQQGMMPSDPGYYFRQNQGYFKALAAPSADRQA